MTYAGQTWWAAVEDIGLLRDGVGAPCRSGCAAAFTESVTDPLGDLIGRYARTHGPFTTTEVATRFGLGLQVTADVLGRMAVDGRLVRGEFVDDLPGDQWCDAEVLRILRRRSLAALRAQVEPVSTAAYGRFLPSWQHVGSTHSTGSDGLAAVIEQLAGVLIPASALESLVFGQRVRDYQPAMLDELLASGEVMWSGAGQIGGGDGWVSFHLAETAPLTLPAPAEIEFTDIHRAIMETLGHGGAYFIRQLTDQAGESELKTALWELIWAGWVTGDTFAPRTGDAVRSPPLRHTGASAASAPAPAQSLQRGASPQPGSRSDGVRPMVGIAWRRTGFDRACPFPGRAATQPARRAHQGSGSGRGRAGRICHLVQGVECVRGCGPLPTRLFRRVAGGCAVRGRLDGRPVAVLPRRGRSPPARVPHRRARRDRPGQSLWGRAGLARTGR